MSDDATQTKPLLHRLCIYIYIYMYIDYQWLLYTWHCKTFDKQQNTSPGQAKLLDHASFPTKIPAPGILSRLSSVERLLEIDWSSLNNAAGHTKSSENWIWEKIWVDFNEVSHNWVVSHPGLFDCCSHLWANPEWHSISIYEDNLSYYKSYLQTKKREGEMSAPSRSAMKKPASRKRPAASKKPASKKQRTTVWGSDG